MEYIYLIVVDGGDNAEYTIIASFDTLELLDAALEKTPYIRGEQHPNINDGMWRLMRKDHRMPLSYPWIERQPRNSFYGWYQGNEDKL